MAVASGSGETAPLLPRDPRLVELRRQYREERHRMTLFSQPITTLTHLAKELLHQLGNLASWLYAQKVYVVLLTVGCLTSWFALRQTTPEAAAVLQDAGYVVVFWTVLGILSSVGLGTGLHTFILFLGPFMAEVTIAAYACHTTDFKPPFHNSVPSTWSTIQCDLPPGTDPASLPEVSLWEVMSKIRAPSLLWGFGTAIGELPPYFMARTARLAGAAFDDDEFEEELADSLSESTGNDLMSRGKRYVHWLVEKAGFWGILLCASFPNPLFDLAGITCGHFLVPFRTFFLATAIGKSLIKLHIQMFFTILLMSEQVFHVVLGMVGSLPVLGESAHTFLKHHREKAFKSFTAGAGHDDQAPKANPFAILFGLFVVGMILYFTVSIINFVAQRHRQREDKERIAVDLKAE